MKNTAMNIIVHVFGSVLHTFLLGIYSGVKFLGHKTCISSTLEESAKKVLQNSGITLHKHL